MLMARAKRHIFKGAEGYHLPEEAASYMALSRAETDNTYFWDIIV
jgi:hypothetical protein